MLAGVFSKTGEVVAMSEKTIQSQGGTARAEKLSKADRTSIAKVAAAARWQKAGKTLPKAKYEGTLVIGDMEIPCAVLDNGTRVLTQSGVMIALGRARQAKGRQYYDSDVDLPAFLTAKNLKAFIPSTLSVTSSQIDFIALNGHRAFGYAAEMLPQICGVFIDAKNANVLTHMQEPIAAKALILIRGFASVGIISLIDEATGYQYERPRRDLEEYLKKFLSEGLRRWVRTFPGDYFKHLCRLKQVTLRPDMKLPQYFGHLTNDLVWKRIAPGLLRALKERRNERGNKSNKLHSWTSEELGKPELLLHLGTVVGLMKIHDDYDKFYAQLNKIAPIYPDSPTLFDDPKDWEVPKLKD
jgi:P63C domain